MDDDVRLRWLIGALLPAAMLVGAPYRIRAHRAGGPVSRKGEGPVILVGLRLTAALAVLLIALWFASPGAPFLLPVSLPPAVRYAGAGLAWATVGLLWWVFHSLGLNLTDTVAVRPAARLVRHGPYRWVRHPLYSVVFLLLTGIALATASLALWFAALGLHAWFRLRLPIEERNLVAHFGDAYREYRRSTGRSWPRFGHRSLP